MFKLLIADDEQLEREALRFIISRSIDFIIDIEEAVNGRDAIAKVQASRPDIVILDINMPGINGLEAAWKIREKDESVCIIILTAFHQFDYAHEAIKIGVEDYIIKPSSEQRIIEVLEKVTARLTRKKSARMEQKNNEIKLNKATDYLSSEFIFNLATRYMKQEKFVNYLALLDMDFHRGRGFVMTLDYETYPILVSTDYQKQILTRRCLRLMTGIFTQQNLSYAYNSDFETIYLLLYSSGEDCDLMESDEKMEDLCRKIHEKILDHLNIRVSLAAGSLFCSAEFALKSFTDAGSSNTSGKNERLKATSSAGLPVELEMDLIKAATAAEREKTDVLFERIEQWSESSSLSLEEIRMSLKDLAVILRHSASTRFPDGNCKVNVWEINKAETLSEVLTAFKIMLNEFLTMLLKLDSREESPVIKLACTYILENYQRDISLEEIAGYCHLSPFYFSKLFKKTMQKNFIDYLSEIRMEEGKRLLTETLFSMKEISNRIGYSNPNYFARVFKSVTNYSPSEFRSNKMLKAHNMKDLPLNHDF